MGKHKILKLSVLFVICIAISLQINLIPMVFGEDAGNSITILFTHDMHDNLLPFQTKENGKIVTLGGYARLQYAINEQKETDPEAILVDGGDFSMGTPFQTIYESDAPELRMLGALGYDVVTLGNHEFDYRPAGLTKSLEAAIASSERLPVIVQSNMVYPVDKDGNLTDTLSGLKKATEDYGVKDYTVIQKNGVVIGVFGLMGAEAASMAPMSEVTFSNEVAAAKRIVKILKEQEKVDLIICLSHSGTNPDKSSSEDEILAKKVPEINVIISGHTHTSLPKPIIIGNTIIGSAEDYGKYLGVMKLNKENGSWKLGNYDLVQINESLPEDNSIMEKVNTFKEIVQKDYFNKFSLGYDDVVAASPIQFDTPEEIYAKHEEATIGNLISDAYVYAVKNAEGDNYIPIAAAVVPCGTIRNTIFKGNITVADAFSISSLGIGADGLPGYPLISVYLTGKELRTICEVDASIAPIMPDAQLYISGINFTFNPHRLIFNKVEKAALITEGNKEEKIDDKKLYRVVCNLYSAQMLSVVGEKSFGLMSLVPKNADGSKITDYEANIIYDNRTGSKNELKEWYAVVQYLQSFDQVDGIPQVPTYYEKTQGRKVIDKSTNILTLVKSPNAISITVYIAVPVIIVLLVFLIVKIVKRLKRRKNRRSR